MSDVLVAPVWIGATLLLVSAAWVVGRRLFPRDPLGPCLMHATTLSWASIAGVATLLGCVGYLSPVLLLAGTTAIAGVALWSCRAAPHGLRLLGATTALAELPTTAGGENGALGCARDQGSPFHYARLALWTFLLAWAISWIIWGGASRFPNGWDTLNYHLPLIVQWLHRGSLYAPDDALWFVPANNELLGLWLVAPFSGDFLVAFLNLPATLLLASGAFELARSLGIARAWQHLTVLAVLAIRPLFRQLIDPGNDVAVAGLFMAVLAYAVRYAGQGRRNDLVLAALGMGLLAGVKYYALGYAGVAAVGLLLLVAGRHGSRAAARVGLLLGLGTCLCGGYWYARNLLVTGSPLYPQGMSPSSDFLRHIRTSNGQTPLWQTTLLGNGDPEVFPLLARAVWERTGVCHASACLFLPITLLWLVVSGIRRCCSADRAGAVRLMLAFWVAGAGLIWGMTPFAAEHISGTLDSVRSGLHPIRYGLCFLSLSVVAAALLLGDLSRGLHGLAAVLQRRANGAAGVKSFMPYFARRVLVLSPVYLATGAVTVAVVYQLAQLARLEMRAHLLNVFLLAANGWLVGAIVVILWQSGPRLRHALLATVVLGVLTGGSAAIAFQSQRWHAGFATRYRDFQVVEQLIAASPDTHQSTTRICAFRYCYYPYFGSRRQFHACRPYWLPTYSMFLDYLKEHEVSLVVALQRERIGVRRYDRISGWLREHPDLFPPLKDESQYIICRVDRARLQAALAAR